MRAIDADALKEDLIRFYDNEVTARKLINEQPTIQPEITHEQAVEYLQSTGWMQEHDRQMMLDGAHRLTAQPEPHWIPVTEKLPYAECGESDNVLATCGYRDVEDGSIRWIKTLYFNGGNWCYPTGETYLEKVYAWMPLPEPYKGVTE